MSVTRSATRQVPLADVALLAGEAFGCEAGRDGALDEAAYSGLARSAVALALVSCLLAAIYLIV